MRQTRSLSATESLLLLVTTWEALVIVLLSPLSAAGPLAGLGLAARLGASPEDKRLPEALRERLSICPVVLPR